MRWAYAGILLLTASWFYTTGIYGHYASMLGMALWAGALAAVLVAAFRIEDLEALPTTLAWRLVIAGTGGLWIWTFAHPYGIGGYALIAAAIIGFLPGQRGQLVARACFHLGLTATLQVPAWFALQAVFAKQHQALFLGPTVAALLRGLGEKAAFNGDLVSLETHMGNLFVGLTFEGLQAGFFLLFLAAFVYWSVAARRFSLRNLLATCLVIGIYSLVRYIAVVLLVVNTQIWSPMYSPHVLLISSLGLIFLVPTGQKRADVPAVARRYARLAAGLAVCSAVALACFLGLSQPGRNKLGRVVINEYHSNWESTKRPYDTRWYGDRSGYNYYLLRKYLEYFYAVRINEQALSDATLADADILILKTPTEPYTLDELNAIDRFVRRGGGVLMMGDHTNVFGMSEYLNQVGRRFGIEFKYNSQHQIQHEDLTLYENSRPLQHPAVHQVPHFLFGTGCTLQPSLWSEDIIVGYANVTMRLDYSVSNFFLRSRRQLDREFGYVNQVSGITYGQGRVVAYTDSTAYSNFWMYMQGKPELLLGMMNWLNKQNAFLPNIKLISVFLFAASLMGLMSFARGTGLALNVLAFALSFSLAVEGTHLLNLWINTVPAPRTSIPEIAFCREGTDYYLPRRELIPRPSEKSIQRGPKQNMPNLSTLYMVPARIGLCPREFDTLNECLSRNPRMLVLVDPLDGLTPQSRQRVVDYVERGGKVLLIAMGNSPRSRLNEILEDYSMAISDEHVKSKALLQRDRKQPSSESVFHGEAIFHPVTGGKPLVGDADHSCLSYATKGEGTLVCFTLGDYLVDERLGGSSSIPNEAQLRLLVLSYWLFEQLFQSSPQNWSDIPTLKEYFGEDYLRATMPPK